MYDVPERDPNPPDRWVDVPHCPECDYDTIGIAVTTISFREIIRWEDRVPVEDEEQDRDDIGYHDPKYYCPGCGAEFDQPIWREELA